MLNRELFARELQALDELFSREPEDWAHTAKREPMKISHQPPAKGVHVTKIIKGWFGKS